MRTITSILLIIWSAFALGQIKNHGAIEMGWKDGRSSFHEGKDAKACFIYPANTFYADLNLDFNWKFVKFGQVIKNNFCYKNGASFSPIDVEFISSISLVYKKFEIGASHSCLHPVINEYTDLERTFRRGSENRVFIRFKW